jgi:diaminopimelate decarboxylase
VQRLGRDLRAISGGGGLSVPYRAGDARVDGAAYLQRWRQAQERIESLLGHPVHFEIEPGRFLVAPAGVLMCEVRAVKDMGPNRYTLVDAGFNDLVRPAFYGAWHEIEVLPRREPEAASTRPVQPSVVAGPLCESGDVFTQSSEGDVQLRSLPATQVEDWLVFHDAGAYGASMASNYNSRPLAAEVLVDDAEAAQPEWKLIRRRQTVSELLALEDVGTSP